MEREQRVTDKRQATIARRKPTALKQAPSSGAATESPRRSKPGFPATMTLKEFSEQNKEHWGKLTAESRARASNQINSKITTDVIDRASEILGNKEKALRWMGTPVRALDFATPISLFGTKKGVERVNRVLGQMEHGIW